MNSNNDHRYRFVTLLLGIWHWRHKEVKCVRGCIFMVDHFEFFLIEIFLFLLWVTGWGNVKNNSFLAIQSFKV